MNLPNKITIVRILLIPVFVLFLLYVNLPYSKYIAASIFIIAALTDTLDGYLARKHNLITNFGKFMDPLADKLLVSSALISFVWLQIIPAWVVIVIISREFIISGFRLIASDNGLVIEASIWGKIKTIFQMVLCIVLIFNFDNKLFFYLGQFLIYTSLILTVISLIDYVSKNKHVLKN